MSSGVAAYLRTASCRVLVEPDDVGRVHGNDERISIENMRLGTQILFATVRGICG